MRCILSKKTDLRNPRRGESGDMKIMGVRKFEFKERDILVIDNLFLDNDMEKVQFHVERDGERGRENLLPSLVVSLSRDFSIPRI